MEWVYLPVALLLIILGMITVGFLVTSGTSSEATVLISVWVIFLSVIWPIVIALLVLSTPFWIGRAARFAIDAWVGNREGKRMQENMIRDSLKAQRGEYGQ